MPSDLHRVTRTVSLSGMGPATVLAGSRVINMCMYNDPLFLAASVIGTSISTLYDVASPTR